MLEALEPLFRRNRTGSDDITGLLVNIAANQVELKGELRGIEIQLAQLTAQVAKTNGRVTEIEVHGQQKDIDDAQARGRALESSDTLISVTQLKKLATLVGAVTALSSLIQIAIGKLA